MICVGNFPELEDELRAMGMVFKPSLDRRGKKHLSPHIKYFMFIRDRNFLTYDFFNVCFVFSQLQILCKSCAYFLRVLSVLGSMIFIIKLVCYN